MHVTRHVTRRVTRHLTWHLTGHLKKILIESFIFVGGVACIIACNRPFPIHIDSRRHRHDRHRHQPTFTIDIDTSRRARPTSTPADAHYQHRHQPTQRINVDTSRHARLELITECGYIVPVYFCVLICITHSFLHNGRCTLRLQRSTSADVYNQHRR
jgi:hypothetical protein